MKRIMRNLCDDCKDCEDNDKSISYCCDVCGIPLDILEAAEKERNKKTQMVDKSNFDLNQYKAELETAHDCGEAKWLKCIEDIKAEIEKRKEIAVRAMFDSHYSLKEQTRGLISGYDSALKTIDRHVNELKGE